MELKNQSEFHSDINFFLIKPILSYYLEVWDDEVFKALTTKNPTTVAAAIPIPAFHHIKGSPGINPKCFNCLVIFRRNKNKLVLIIPRKVKNNWCNKIKNSC